jgi:hypothetical protein
MLVVTVPIASTVPACAGLKSAARRTQRLRGAAKVMQHAGCLPAICMCFFSKKKGRRKNHPSLFAG